MIQLMIVDGTFTLLPGEESYANHRKQNSRCEVAQKGNGWKSLQHADKKAQEKIQFTGA